MPASETIGLLTNQTVLNHMFIKKTLFYWSKIAFLVIISLEFFSASAQQIERDREKVITVERHSSSSEMALVNHLQ